MEYDEDLHQKMQRLATERMRLLEEEERLKVEAQRELDRINAEIDRLEARRESLEAFLGVDPAKRLQHGMIRDLCFDILAKHSSGLTSGQIKEIIERDNPGIRTGSVPASLSYQAAQGRLRRDSMGRYTLAE